MGKFVVIDTETTWDDKVMSIGIVVVDKDSFDIIDKLYYLIAPEYKAGGMYSYALRLPSVKINRIDNRENIINLIKKYLNDNDINMLFAYNAKFDYNHLPELYKYEWYDIMRLAAYKEYNINIKNSDFCYSSGRLKTNYGVENILRLLSKNSKYREKHNALRDAEDELKIIQLLGYDIDFYKNASINASIICYAEKSENRITAIYSEKINDITSNKISVLDFDYKLFEATYKCNICGHKWTCRTAKFYKDFKCSCPQCSKK